MKVASLKLTLTLTLTLTKTLTLTLSLNPNPIPKLTLTLTKTLTLTLSLNPNPQITRFNVFSVFYICSRPPTFLYYIKQHNNNITHFLSTKPLLINKRINFSTFSAVFLEFCWRSKTKIFPKRTINMLVKLKHGSWFFQAWTFIFQARPCLQARLLGSQSNGEHLKRRKLVMCCTQTCVLSATRLGCVSSQNATIVPRLYRTHAAITFIAH